jgi:hypothetical protein
LTARLTILIVTTMVGAALVAGCGGDDDDTTVTTSSLSKAAYVKKADDICDRGRRKIIAYQIPPEEKLSPEESFENLVDEAAAPAFGEVVDEVRDLGAPRGDEPRVEAFLAAMRQAIEQLEESHESEISAVETPFRRSAKLARGYGFDRCAYSE